MGKFGQTGVGKGSIKTSGGGGGKAGYVRYFKDPVTTLRILQPTNTWLHFKSHYVQGPGTFWCPNGLTPTRDVALDPSKCPECTRIVRMNTDPEEVENELYAARKTSIWVNAFEPKREAQKPEYKFGVYNIGVKLWDLCVDLQRRKGTLMDRNCDIIKVGAQLDTVYSIEPGDREEFVFPDEIVDLNNMVGRQWARAMGVYEFDYDPADLEDVQEAMTPAWRFERLDAEHCNHYQVGQNPGQSRIAPPADEAQAGAFGQTEPDVEPAGYTTPSAETPEDWTNKMLKAYLDDNNEAYTERATRQTLLEKVTAHMAKTPASVGASEPDF